ncbi:HpcH/HpaI aldolase family protein [Modestobacter excelsi]|uniref:HpcH/HpaI aldolase family protein n=1 Tax=Modestobacter excelsi TaxID=2213161 RepID=UPI001C20E411|nr:aldolase/citrate lyase family protein [Modestobacter excelsi]
MPAGMIVSSSDPALTEIVALAGYEFVVIDGEHAPLGPAEWVAHVRAAEARGTIPMVRVPENRAVLIQQAVDVGAQAVVVPHVETAADAEAAVAALRLPRAGSRGRCSSIRAAGFSRQGWEEHSRLVDAEVLVIPIVESELAVHNLEAILDVDGIDHVQFGPGDLSVDLGVDMDSPVITQSYERVLTLARARDKHVIGVDVIPPPPGARPSAVLQSADLLHVATLMKQLRGALADQFADAAGAGR